MLIAFARYRKTKTHLQIQTMVYFSMIFRYAQVEYIVEQTRLIQFERFLILRITK